MTGGSSPKDGGLRAAGTPGEPWRVQDRGEPGQRAGRGWVGVGLSWGAGATCSSSGWGGPEQQCVGDLRDLSGTCKDTVRLSLGSLSLSQRGCSHAVSLAPGRGGLQAVGGEVSGGRRLARQWHPQPLICAPEHMPDSENALMFYVTP